MSVSFRTRSLRVLVLAILAVGALILPASASAADAIIGGSLSGPFSNVNVGTATTVVATITSNNSPQITAPTAKISVPGGVTVGVLPGGCSQSGSLITCIGANIPANSYNQVTWSIPVTPTTAGHHAFSSQMTHSDQDFYQPVSMDTDVNAVLATSVNVGLNSAGFNPQNAIIGSNVTVSFDAYNQGPGTAANTSLTYTVPSGYTYLSSTKSTGGSCSNAAGTVTCAWGSVNASTNVQATVTLSTGGAPGYRIHQYSVSTTSVENNSSDNSNSIGQSVWAAGSTNLTSTLYQPQTFPPPYYLPGDDMFWYEGLSNSGPNTADNMTLTATTTGGVIDSFDTSGHGTCVLSNGNHDAVCNIGTVPSGIGYNVQFHSHATSPGGYAVHTVQTASQADADDSGTVHDFTVPILDPTRANVSAYVSFNGSTTPAPNVNTDFTLSFGNQGPAASANSTVSVQLPPNAKYKSHGVVATNGSANPATACTFPAVDSVGSVITCNFGTVTGANGYGSIPSIVVQGTSNGVGNFVATATTSTADTNTSNDSSSTSWRVHNSDGDLATTTLMTPQSPKLGDVATIKVSVTNYDPPGYTVNAVPNLSIVDTLPSGWTYVSATGTGLTCGNNSNVVTCTKPSLAANSLAEVYITANVAGTAGTKINQASAAHTGVEINPANNSENRTIIVGAAATSDLEVTSGNPASQSLAPNAQYDISAHLVNHGGSAATNATATIALPAGDTKLNASIAGGTCSGSGPITCTVASLAAGASVSVQASVQARATPGTAQFSVTSSTSTGDPDSSNNAASRSIVVLNPSGADLQASFEIPNGQPTALTAGQQAVYYIHFRNAGGQVAVQPHLTITIPSGVVNPYVNGGTCTGTAPTLQCTETNVNANTDTYAILQFVPVTTGVQYVSVSETSMTNDLNPGDNSASDSSVTLQAPGTALVLTSHATPAAVPTGSNVSWTYDIANNADPSSSTHLALTLPDGFALVSATPTAGSCTPSGQSIDCSLGTVANGFTSSPDAQVTIVATTPAAGLYPVTATVTSGTAEGDTSDNSVSTDITVTGPPGTADFAISSITTPGGFTVGQDLNYAVSVRNNGPTADTAVVTLTLPLGGATFTTSSTTSGSCAAPVSGLVTCSLALVASSSTVDIHVHVTPTSGVDETLTAAVSASNLPDPTSANNSKSMTAHATGPALVATGSSAFTDQVVGTASVPKTIVVTNDGDTSGSIAAVGVIGAAAADFGTTTTCGGSIPVHGHCNVSVTFTPVAGGARSASLSISSNDPNSPTLVALIGNGIAATVTPPTPLPTPPATGDHAAPAVALPGSSTVTVNAAGDAVVNVSCPTTEVSCTGTVELTIPAALAARKKKPPVKIGSKAFSIAGGKTVAVKVRLTKAGRRALAKRKVLKVTATWTLRDLAGNQSTKVRTYTFRAPKPKPHH